MRRVIVDHFNVGREARARVRPLDKVVRQQGIARETPVEHSMERRDLVDALAGKNTLAVKILVHVGNGPRVNVETRLPRVDGGEPRA